MINIELKPKYEERRGIFLNLWREYEDSMKLL